MRSFLRAKWPAALALSAVWSLFSASPAQANGRYPAAGLVALDPSDPMHIVVRTTYGLISSADGGTTWKWVCEQSVGFSDNEDPMVVITQNGTMLAGVFKGLAVSTDRGCDWAFVGGELEARYAVDLSTEKGAPEHAVAILSNGIGGGKFNTQVYESLDNGSSWKQAGVNLPEEFLGLTIDAAPSDPKRLYATGRYGSPDYVGTLERSPDRGATWERLDITGADDKHPPYLAAVDPTDPDRLYVRLDAAEKDQLVFSDDGGATWKMIFEGEAGLFGFALSPDGKKVAIGGDKDGLWMAPTDTFAFTKVSDIRVKCLLWSNDTIFACADEFKDGFHVGLSKNEGKTFEALEHLSQICPMECAAETSSAMVCPVRWGAVALTIDAKSCDSGSGGSGASGGNGGNAGGGSGNTGGGSAGCSCSTTEGHRETGVAVGACLALLLGVQRRKQKRLGSKGQ